MSNIEQVYTGQEIAVVGLSLRVRNVKTIDEFWNNLKNGVELISFYSDDQLSEVGKNHDLLKNPNYVKAGSLLKDKEYFDAAFFSYTPREAELLDPQIRLFHEVSWEALEDSGVDPGTYPGLIGVYAGASQNLEWEARVLFSGKNRFFDLRTGKP
ncbi:MAG: hypothetical protein GY950_31265 [bacterium]|nr:hypothetical protein [bacterium]